MLARLLAVVLAGVMVVGALALRARMDAGPAASGDPPGGGRVHCVSELAAICDRLPGEGDLAVQVVDAGMTLAALAGAPTGASADQAEAGQPDAWLTLAPLPQIARDRRTRAGLQPLLGEDRPPLGRSPLLLAVWGSRAGVLEPVCGGPITWACVGDAAPATWAELGGPVTWGPVKPGHADPNATAGGLLVLSQAAASRVGRTDLSTRDLEDQGFFSWFTGLERAVPSFRPSAGSHLREMVLTGPSTFDVAGVLEAEAVPLLATGRAPDLQLRDSTPVATADVVIVGVGPDGEGVADLVAERAGRLLAANAWRVDGEALDERLEPRDLPEGNGLPSAGAMEALRTTWLEVAG
jgi:hypothetical protein